MLTNVGDNIAQSLESDVPNKNEIDSDLRKDNQEVSTKTQSDIPKTVNGAVLLDFLSPEVRKNEKVKRTHKFILIGLVAIFLYFQFNSVYELSLKIIEYATGESVDIEILKLLIGFITGYITSVVVELIAILNYVVKNVFDTSIAELIKIFKEDEKSKKE